MIEAIVAVYGDWGIGAGGTQPVVVSADRKHFRDVTGGSAVIVGRKTLADFPGGRPLKNRDNIVLTRQDIAIEGAKVVHSAEEALEACAGYDRVFVIGGESVYRTLIPYVCRVHVTKLDCVPRSDAFFPDLDADPDWEVENEGEEQTDASGVRFRFMTYVRRLAPEYEAALRWLRQDALTRMGAVTSVLRRSSELLWLGEDGISLRDGISRIHYLFGSGAEHLGEAPAGALFVADAASAEILGSRYGLSGRRFLQMCYPAQTPPAGGAEARLRIAAPTDGELAQIDGVYELEDLDGLRRDRARGGLFAAHDAEGAFVGYMGIHSDGSMGILEVFPEFRRRGYAEELERFILSKILAEGRTPFCQIAEDNAASLALQRKLGLVEAPGYVWYIH